MIIEDYPLDEEHSLYGIQLSCQGETRQQAEITWDLVSNAEYVRLLALHDQLAGCERGPYKISRNGDEQEVDQAEALLSRLLDAGAKGLHLQRYKGLGEMNPEQLWDTTMDPARRTLLQVKVEDTLAADEMFTTLMGDEVEPRREFIIENALDVRVLDI